MQQKNERLSVPDQPAGVDAASESHATEAAARATAAIPDIEIGRVYDTAYRDAPVHYATFGSMADFFGRDPAPHRHDRFYQLHFVQTGHLRLRLDDMAHVADGPVFFLTPPSVPHAFSTNPTASGHVMTVAQQLVRRLFDDDPSLARHLMAEPRCIALPGPDGQHRTRELARLFGLLRRELETARSGRAASVEALTRLILVAAFRLIDTPQEEGGARRHDLSLLRRFHELVDQHFAHHWTLSRYAGSLHITEARLNDLCNRLTTRSPKRIVQERLALEARRFLTFSRLSIDEIADALGYADTAYFCRVFKRHHAVTPSAYRATNSGKVQLNLGKVPSTDAVLRALSEPIKVEGSI